MIHTASDITHDIELSVDACVIGSGAGGAVVAKELAEGGWGVTVLEEGGHHTKEQFNRRPADMLRLLYRDAGMTVTVGIPPVIIPTGRVVGGTTVINMGTCFRTPEAVLHSWREVGLDISAEQMEPYFERVEKFLGVEPVDPRFAGKNTEIVARGAARLGLRGDYLRRNAVHDRGCGVCAFGCPEDSKKAMHISYIPEAVRRGAEVFANCRAERIELRENRVFRVTGSVLHPATGQPVHRFTLYPKVLIVSAGTLYTPVLLLNSKIAAKNRYLGRNLSLHPALRVAAEMDELVEGWKGVPQSYYIDEYADEGIMLEGIFVPPSIESMAMPFFGLRQQEILARYPWISTFGVMVSDTSKGVVKTFRGRPLIFYQLNRTDTAKLMKGIEIVSRIYFAAGAKRVFTGLHSLPIVHSSDEAAQITATPRPATDMELTAYHPLGTARMGRDPATSVVNGFGRLHDVENLFVADGSIFPTSLGVNPQLSIMAFATRTAFHILETLTPGR